MQLSKGNKVVMHSCIQSKLYKGKIWECLSDSYIAESGDEVVFLKGFSGFFSVEYLQIVTL